MHNESWDDIFHLIRTCADEVARKARECGVKVDPEEMLGEGWIGVEIANGKHQVDQPFLPLARECVMRRLLHAFVPKKGRRKMLTNTM